MAGHLNENQNKTFEDEAFNQSYQNESEVKLDENEKSKEINHDFASHLMFAEIKDNDYSRNDELKDRILYELLHEQRSEICGNQKMIVGDIKAKIISSQNVKNTFSVVFEDYFLKAIQPYTRTNILNFLWKLNEDESRECFEKCFEHVAKTNCFYNFHQMLDFLVPLLQEYTEKSLKSFENCFRSLNRYKRHPLDPYILHSLFQNDIYPWNATNNQGFQDSPECMRIIRKELFNNKKYNDMHGMFFKLYKDYFKITTNEEQFENCKIIINSEDYRQQILDPNNDYFNLFSEFFKEMNDKNKIRIIKLNKMDKNLACILVRNNFTNLSSQYKIEMIKEIILKNINYDNIEDVKSFFNSNLFSDEQKKEIVNFCQDNYRQGDFWMKQQNLNPNNYYLMLYNSLYFEVKGEIVTDEEFEKILNCVGRMDKNTFNSKLQSIGIDRFTEKNKKILQEFKEKNFKDKRFIFDSTTIKFSNLVSLLKKLDIPNGLINVSNISNLIKIYEIPEENIIEKIKEGIDMKKLAKDFLGYYININKFIDANNQNKLDINFDKNLLDAINFLKFLMEKSEQYKKLDAEIKNKIEKEFKNLNSEENDNFYKGILYRKEIANFLKSTMVACAFRSMETGLYSLMTTFMLNNCSAGKAQAAATNKAYIQHSKYCDFLNNININCYTALMNHYPQEDFNHLQKGIENAKYYLDTFVNFSSFVENAIHFQNYFLKDNSDLGVAFDFMEKIKHEKDFTYIDLKKSLISNDDLPYFEECLKLYNKMIIEGDDLNFKDIKNNKKLIQFIDLSEEEQKCLNQYSANYNSKNCIKSALINNIEKKIVDKVQKFSHEEAEIVIRHYFDRIFDTSIFTESFRREEKIFNFLNKVIKKQQIEKDKKDFYPKNESNQKNIKYFGGQGYRIGGD